MSNATEDLQAQRAEVYRLQQQVIALKSSLFGAGEAAPLQKLIDAQNELMKAERDLVDAEAQAARATSGEDAEAAGREAAAPSPAMRSAVTRSAQPAGAGERGTTRGVETTGLAVKPRVRMEYVPTGIYHLLSPSVDPLLECTVKAARSGDSRHGGRNARRVRVTAYIEDYSARAVETLEVPVEQESAPILLLPTLFPDRISSLYELTRATLNVLAEDLDSQKVEEHHTYPLWLLARNAATFEIRNPTTGEIRDLRHLLGAYVTPNHPAIQRFLQVTANRRSEHRLAGRLENATAQAQAIYDALQHEAAIVYVNSTLTFNPTLGAQGQRVRLPHECLAEKQANCLDGSLLFASLLEALGLAAAVVLVPGHALVGWQSGAGENGWRYLETTMLANQEFDAATKAGADLALLYQKRQTEAGAPAHSWFYRLELSDLRSRRITPLA